MVSYEKFACLVLIAIGICLAVMYIEKDTIENFTFEKKQDPQHVEPVATNDSSTTQTIIMIDPSGYSNNTTNWYSTDNGYTWANVSTYRYENVYYNSTEVPGFENNITLVPVNIGGYEYYGGGTGASYRNWVVINYTDPNYLVVGGGGGGAGSYVIREPVVVTNYNQTNSDQPTHWNWTFSNWSDNDSTTQQTSTNFTTSYSCQQIIVNGVVTKDTCSGT
jgi:hypothetical protein